VKVINNGTVFASMYSKAPPKKLLFYLKSLKNKDCIITFHSLADLDACASALALKEHIGKKAVVAMQDSINSQARSIVESYEKTKMTDFELAIKSKPKSKIIVLDCNEIVLIPKLNGREIDVLIDHHAKSPQSVNAEIEWIDPESSAVCQMISQIVKKPNLYQAELLSLGIISDSAYFANSNSDTFSQISKLLKNTQKDYSQLLSMLHSPQSVESRIRVLEGLRNINFAQEGRIICAAAQVSSGESAIAEILLNCGADCAFVASGSKTKCVISARMRRKWTIHVPLPKIMEEVGEFIGGSGGGHPAAAGASGKFAYKLEDALDMCQSLFFEHSVARIKIEGKVLTKKQINSK